MPKTIINLSGTGGLVAKYHIGASTGPVNDNWYEKIWGRDDQYADGLVDPTRKMGYLSPASNTFTAVTGIFSNTEIIATLPDNNNRVGYFLDRGTMMYYLNNDYTDTSLSESRGIVNTTGTDLEVYQVNGATKLFRSYIIGTNGNIAISDIGASGASNFNDVWFTATATSGGALGANYHRMIVADDGKMYVLDGPNIHKIDGTADTGGANGTATLNVVQFPANYKCIDGFDARTKMWIAVMKTGRTLQTDTNTYRFTEKAGIYVWDKRSTEARLSDFIPIPGVREIRAIFPFRGLPYCFTISSLNQTELRAYNGNIFDVVEELDQDAYPMFHDSIHVTSDLVTWLGRSGKIYRYGRIHTGLKDGLYKIGDISGQATGTYNKGGAILGAGTVRENYYMCFGETSPTVGRVRIWQPTLTSNNPHAGYTYTLVKTLPKLSTVKSATIYYLPLSTSGTTQNMVYDVYFNQSNSTTRASIVLTHDDAARSYKYFPIGQRGVNFIQFSLRWNSALTLSNCITPSMLELEYEPETKKI